MAFKRLIAMVPVQDGQVVMSYGYTRHKPAGGLGSVLRNLDRWGVDEIAVIDISLGLKAPDFSLLEQVRRAAIRTPVAFGGGIRRSEHAVRAIALGCDRVIVETLLWTAQEEVARIGLAVGQQAIIGATPLAMHAGVLHARQAHGSESLPWDEFSARIADAAISELLLIDREHEGGIGSHAIASQVPVRKDGPKIIWFGGIGEEQAAALLARPDTVGLAVGNAFLRKELSALEYRTRISTSGRASLVRHVRAHG